MIVFAGVFGFPHLCESYVSMEAKVEQGGERRDNVHHPCRRHAVGRLSGDADRERNGDGYKKIHKISSFNALPSGL